MQKIMITMLLLLLSSMSAKGQTPPIDTDDDGYYNISTLDHLRWVSENTSSWSWNYELDNNIDAKETKNWNSSQGWSPIGANRIGFSGRFEGNGFVIDSLFISRGAQDDIGLFGYIVGTACSINNLGITNSTIVGRSKTGGLVGKNKGASINNCYLTGSVAGSEDTGGLVGYNYGASISNSYSTGRVSGSTKTGGLVGYNSGYISNSYSTGNVSGSSYTGGLVGENYRGKISNSYSTGSVSVSSYSGGLVGENKDGDITNCFWDKETSGKTTSAGGIEKTTLEMKTKSTFEKAFWNFYAIWKIDTNINNGYPYIDDRTIPKTVAKEPKDTDSDGFRNIKYLAHLVWVSENASSWSSKFELDNDISADSTKYWISGKGWSPIGNNGTKFMGKFQGNGYKIDSLFICRGTQDSIGLFGYIGSNGCSINNLGITNSTIVCRNNTGGLVGITEGGTITNCYSTGRVFGSLNTGGLVGCFDVGTITNSYSTVEVSGSTNTGGLVGRNGSTIINSYSTGSVTGSTKTGGLVGCIDGGTITNSYSTGSVSGSNAKGGLVGYDVDGTITNCFWDLETSSQTKSYGGIGKSTSEMKTKSIFTDAGWDFIYIWDINPNVNDGYPNLSRIPNAITDEINPTTEIYISPNPATTKVDLQINVTEGTEATLTIFDLNGKEMINAYEGMLKQGGNSLQINCEALPNGVYNLILQTDSQKLTKRFVVVR